MVQAPKDGQKSKSQAVRDYLAENKKATADDVVKALSAHGITITEQLVSDVKYRDKKAKGRRGRKRPTNNKSQNQPAGRKRGGKNRPYPQKTLEDALAVPKVIRELNNGNPWGTDQVAKALKVSRQAEKFFYLAAAARDYGLTTGSRDTDQIELAELGKHIVLAKDEDTRRQKKIDAFFKVDLFKKVYDYYNGSKSIPVQEFFGNVLQTEFALDPDFHNEFAEIFKANCKYLAIEDGLGPLASAKARKQDDATADVRVIGEAKGKFDRTAFVIMPFTERGETPRSKGFFSEVLKSIVVPAGNKEGFSVETAQQKGSDIIHTTIINRLLEADLVIADLTDHNPNVLFELGIRLAAEKPVALIRAEGTARIFDVDIIRVADYSPNLWASTVKDDVERIADIMSRHRGTIGIQGGRT
jgi:hypothetical protein